MNDLEFLDILNILSFVIGVMNYQENLTQGDKQDLLSKVDSQTKVLLDEIHSHLERQDKLIEEILHEKDSNISRPNR